VIKKQLTSTIYFEEETWLFFIKIDQVCTLYKYIRNKLELIARKKNSKGRILSLEFEIIFSLL